MRLTKISLTNFRSFKETQSIEIASVTLLFGPNSADKSSVLMALAYSQQILEKGHCDPQRFDSMGRKSIGGFQALVHAQDLSKSIKLSVSFHHERTFLNSYRSNVDELSNHLPDVLRLLMDDFEGSTQSGTVEFEICWSNRFKTAYVKNYRVWINEIYLGCINSSEDQKRTVIGELNTQHPLLIPYNHSDWFEMTYGEENERSKLEDDDFHTEFEGRHETWLHLSRWRRMVQ